jgi:hypothetical protein
MANVREDPLNAGLAVDLAVDMPICSHEIPPSAYETRIN